MTSQDIQKKLFEMQDAKYKEFQAKLIPTINADTVIGVRAPEIRKFAKELYKNHDASEFLQSLPHQYYDENNLHGALIELQKDYEQCIDLLNAFLPHVDNWATCDMMAPKVFKKHLPELAEQIKVWMGSGDTYTIRFGVDLLMKYYLDAEFKPEYLEMVAQVKSEEYYLKMVVAWYFATALAKQYDAAVSYIGEQKLDAWTHNKTIQKAVESYRVSAEQKAYLKTLKRR